MSVNVRGLSGATCPRCRSVNVPYPIGFSTKDGEFLAYLCLDCGLRWWTPAREDAARAPGPQSLGFWKSFAAWFGLALLLYVDAHTGLPEGSYQGAWIGALISGIATVFGFIAGHAVTFAVMVAHVAVQIAFALAHFAIALGHVFLKVYGLLGKFWSGALKPFIAFVARNVEKLSGWLKRVLGPVIRTIEAIRKYVDRFYERWIRPILDTIETTRRVLQLLAALRVPFARALDAKLAQLEDRLLAPIRFIYAKLNEIMGWVNRIITLDGLLQRITLLRSLIRYQKDTLTLWWKSIHRALSAEERRDYEAPLKTRTIDAAHADLRAYVASGDGPDRARIDEHAADLGLRLRRGSFRGL